MNGADGLYATLTNILRQSESLIIVIASETYVIVEGTSMLAERYKQKRFEDGLAEGLARANRKWAEWNRRREAAQQEGRPFDEPPPDIERASANGSD